MKKILIILLTFLSTLSYGQQDLIESMNEIKVSVSEKGDTVEIENINTPTLITFYSTDGDVLFKTMLQKNTVFYLPYLSRKSYWIFMKGKKYKIGK